MAEVTDPVCGMTFDDRTADELGAHKVVHNGATIWFCCADCEKEFRASPDDYL